AAVRPGTRATNRVWACASADEDFSERDVRPHATNSVVEIVGARCSEAQLPIVARDESRGPRRDYDRTAPRPDQRGILVNTDSGRADGAQWVLPGSVSGTAGKTDRAVFRWGGSGFRLW